MTLEEARGCKRPPYIRQLVPECAGNNVTYRLHYPDHGLVIVATILAARSEAIARLKRWTDNMIEIGRGAHLQEIVIDAYSHGTTGCCWPSLVILATRE